MKVKFKEDVVDLEKHQPQQKRAVQIVLSSSSSSIASSSSSSPPSSSSQSLPHSLTGSLTSTESLPPPPHHHHHHHHHQQQQPNPTITIVQSSVQLVNREEDGEESNESKFGWFGFRPECLQFLCKPKCVLFTLSLIAFFHSALFNGVVSLILSTLERRYRLTSVASGTYSIMYELATVFASVPVTYLGSTRSKPRWLAIGLVIVSFGCFINCLVQFIGDDYDISYYMNTSLPNSSNNNRSFDSSEYLCNSEGGGDVTTTTTTNLMQKNCTSGKHGHVEEKWKFLLFVGQFIGGLGSIPLYTLGVTYLDQHVLPHQAALHFAIFYSCATLGPAFGYTMGSLSLKLNVDFYRIDEKHAHLLLLDETNPNWVGCWWLIILFLGFLMLLFAFLISGFPKKLKVQNRELHVVNSEMDKSFHNKGVQQISVTQLSKQQMSDFQQQRQHAVNKLKEFLHVIKYLLSNVTLVLLIALLSSSGLFASGFVAFLPKYIEYQYSTSASWASLAVGLVCVPAAFSGTLLAGVIIKKLKLQVLSILKMILTSLCLVVLVTFGLLFNCSSSNLQFISRANHHLFLQQQTAGRSVQQHPFIIFGSNRTTSNNKLVPRSVLHLSCNKESFERECHACSQEASHLFEPVCARMSSYGQSSSSSSSFASAALPYEDDEKKSRRFEEQVFMFQTACLAGCHAKSGQEHTQCHCTTSGEAGSCDTYLKHDAACERNKYLFLLTAGVASFLIFFTTVPLDACILRCVPDSQKPITAGIRSTIGKLVGSVPGPIFFGLIIDQACLHWSEASSADCSSSSSSRFCHLYNKVKLSHYIVSLCVAIQCVAVLVCMATMLAYRAKNQQKQEARNLSTSSSNVNVNLKSVKKTSSSGEIYTIDAKKGSSEAILYF